MPGITPVQKPYKGCLAQPHVACHKIRRARPGRSRSKLWGAARRAFGRFGQSAREDRGSNPVEGFCWKTLEGRNPWEQPAVGVLTPCRSPGTLARVKAQKPRPAGPARRFGDGINGRRNGTWVLSRGNAWIPCGRRKLRRVNPRSAAGVKQNRHGLEGSKPPRGQPNPAGGT